MMPSTVICRAAGCAGWIATLALALLAVTPTALAETGRSRAGEASTGARGTAVARLRGVVEEIQSFAHELEHWTAKRARSEVGRQSLLAALDDFERSLPGLKRDARVSLQQIEAEISGYDRRRSTGSARPPRDVLFHLQARRRQLDADGPWYAEPRIEGVRRTARHRRAQAFARLFVRELLDREIGVLEPGAVPASALEPALFSLRTVGSRLDAFFRAVESALPRTIAAVRTGGARFDWSLDDLAILGRTPSELARAVDRVQEAMLAIVRTQVDWIESTAAGSNRTPDPAAGTTKDPDSQTIPDAENSPDTEKRSRP